MSFPSPFDDETPKGKNNGGSGAAATPPPWRRSGGTGEGSMTTAPNKPAPTAAADSSTANGGGDSSPRQPLSAYEARLRREVDSFQFDSLLQGIGGDKPASAAPVRGLEPDRPTRSVPTLPADPYANSASAPRNTPITPPLVGAAPAGNAPAGRRVLTGLAAVLLVASLVGGRYWLQRHPGATGAASRTGMSAGLPDPSITPGEVTTGAILPATSEISEPVRRMVLGTYRISPMEERRYVLCRLIPLSLHGTSSAMNVFPATPWFSELKLRLDRELTAQVARGTLTEAQAQKELKTNWVRAAHQHFVRNYGENDPGQSRQIEKTLKWKYDDTTKKR